MHLAGDPKRKGSGSRAREAIYKGDTMVCRMTQYRNKK